MRQKKIFISGIPAIVWGEPSESAFVHVHGKLSRKEYAGDFAKMAETKGYQRLSFDLPEHGERTDGVRCDIWNGMRELNIVADHAFERWGSLSLYACSIGAYFALNSYAERPFEQCLFQSPIVDMEWLVRRMMEWAGVDGERLEREGEIETPIDTLRWDYYRYILAHPVRRWDIPTAILYGGRDALQSREVVAAFSERFGCRLTVSEQSEHPFMGSGDGAIVAQWIEDNMYEGKKI